MNIHEKYIKRCLELAKFGLREAQPNPSVGCVIVHGDRIIGEGYTSAYGGPHAEVNAIRSVKDRSLLKTATLYVSLEPCTHFGKTPPCTDLILTSEIKNIVIGCTDPFIEVAGRGIEKLENHGCQVITGVLEQQCIESHRRFFTNQQEKRPYIILKWAQSLDGFIDIDRTIETKQHAQPNWITGLHSRQLVHKWRSNEAAILVGTTTVLNDNPKLTVRDWYGPDPVRVVLDQKLRIPETYSIYDGSIKTIILTAQQKSSVNNVIYEQIDFSSELANQICEVMNQHHLTSLIIEGGRQTLQTFIDANLWDEARIFTGSVEFNKGVSAPKLNGKLVVERSVALDKLKIVKPVR